MKAAQRAGAWQCYFYWRVAAADVERAFAAVMAWQDELMQADPHLLPQLHRRPGVGDQPCTLMEVYAISAERSAQGIDEALTQRLVAEGDVASQPWRIGQRHLERFEQLR